MIRLSTLQITYQLMTTKQLKEWLFNNSADDQWWVNIDGIAEQEPVTISPA